MGRRSRKTQPKAPPASSVVVIPDDDSPEDLFSSYANKATRTIEPEGIEKLCSDLGIEHTDVRILILAWKMSAAKMGYFTRAEWQNGFAALRADSMYALSRALTELEKKVRRASKEEFLEFYTYAFNYCLTEDMQKTVETESVCELLGMVLGLQFPAQAGKLVEYLKLQTEYKAINKDQWSGFYRFCTEISFPDMANYDENSCYPSVIDGFAEWMKEGKI
ncbi:hypothetical protein MKW94_023650 [Papaver nudicaule]|uniref:Defective in cullin neddylation protein n=1 Tax=Papaver nudicaule TaxID=74823 RepID=A0AA41SHY1_PAPNU|nr:hypothetical protein [Papaver nudicaule]